MRFLTLAALLWGCQDPQDPKVPFTPTPGDAYAVVEHPDGGDRYMVMNDERATMAVFAAQGVTMMPDVGDAYAITFGTASIGRDTMVALADVEPTASGRDVRFTSGDTVTWFHHDEEGLEQGFDIASRPAGSGDLHVQIPLTMRGIEARPMNDGVRFVDEGGFARLTYTKLVVVDSTGADVPAKMELGCNDACMVFTIEDASAQYPLTIDPVLISQELAFTPGSGAVGNLVALANTRAVTYDSVGHQFIVFDRPVAGTWTQTGTLAVGVGVAGSVVDLDMSYDTTNNNYFLIAGIAGMPQVYVDGGADGTWDFQGTLAQQGPVTAAYGTKVASSGRRMMIGDAASGRYDVIDMPTTSPFTPPTSNHTNYLPGVPIPGGATPITALDLDQGSSLAYITGPTGMLAYLASTINRAPQGPRAAAYIGHVEAGGGFVAADTAGVTHVLGGGASINSPPLFVATGTNAALAFPATPAFPRMYTNLGTDTVQVYEDPTGLGAGWKPEGTVTPAGGAVSFGTSIAARGDNLIVGAPLAPTNGAAFLFGVEFGNVPVVGGAFTVAEGATHVVTSSEVFCADVEDGASDLEWSFDGPTVGGTLRLSGTPLTTSDTFTQQDIIDGNIDWVDGGNDPGAPPRELLLTCTDTLFMEASVAVNITVTPVNDAPVIDLMQTTSSWTENLGPVGMAGAGTTVTDSDSDIDQVEIAALNFQAGDTLAVTLGASGLSFDSGTGILSGTATPATYASVLATLTFDHTTEDPDPTSRVYELVATDSDGLDGPVYTHTVSITPINDPPVLGGSLARTQKKFLTVDFTPAELTATDPDDDAVDVVFTITSIDEPSQVQILLNGGPLVPGLGTFTLDDLNNDRVAIRTLDPTAATIDIDMSLEDPQDPGIPPSFTFVLTIDPIAHVNVLTNGDLVINEIMKDPAGTERPGEWFEFYNATALDIDLDGLVVSRTSTNFTVTGTTVIAPGTFAVFGHNDGPAAVQAVLTYDMPNSFRLGNGADLVRLTNTLGTIDEVAYDSGATFPDLQGRSLNFDGDLALGPVPTPDTTNNPNGAFWCDAWSTEYEPGERGTPGSINDDCQALDFDLDGFVSDAVGGNDCDDFDDTIFPGAPDPENDGIDQNCDGTDADLGIGDLNVGDLVITEAMIRSANGVTESNGEWFEVYIAAPGLLPTDFIDLAGLVVSDNGSNSIIIGSFVVSPGDYALFMANTNSAVNGGITATPSYDYVRSNFNLGNSSDAIILTDPSGPTEFDRIEYDNGATFPDPAGATMSLDPASEDPTSNDDGLVWCDGRSVFGSGQFGTPGAANESCSFGFDFVFEYTPTSSPPFGYLVHVDFDHDTGTFVTDNGGVGSYSISSGTGGQTLQFTYIYQPNTQSITYSHTRSFGNNLRCTGAISGDLPAGWVGTWDQDGCP
ncbi:MAG: lamin tail domain-containing protein [Myxococcota bacterium]